MATATQTKQAYLGELYEHTAGSVTNSLANWTGFLTTVVNLYKYPFHEQFMIYAQRPDATACAEYGLWNDTMNRYVHRGTKGIALMDVISENPKIKYVFDVSYTLMKRCGLDTESYFEHEDFSPIFDFNTSAAVSLLGAAVSEQSEQVFRQISLTIIKTERERSNEHEQNHLQPEWGLSDTRPHIDGASDTAPRQIRHNEESLSGETPQSSSGRNDLV